MSLEFSQLLGSVAHVSTVVSDTKSLKNFLDTFDNLGIQVTNNFEINFSGLQDIMMYAASVSIPGIELKTTEVFYDGKKVELPVNYDWNHDFSMTMINDANGYIYSTLVDFIMTNSNSFLVNSGYTMTIKALTGNDNYKGTMYTLYGVKIVNVGNLQYSHDSQDKSTFEVSLKCNYFTATPGAVDDASNIIGAINSIIS